MGYSYRTLQLWNEWLIKQFWGREMLEEEMACLRELLVRHFGKQALLLGVPSQRPLLSSTSIPCHSLATPLNQETSSGNMIETDLHELPFLTGSIDLVILPHTLEFIDHPRHLLNEACRIIKPEGLIIICGFNPYSWWGLKQYFNKHKSFPRPTHSIETYQIKKWLSLADFALEAHTSILFRPPFFRANIHKKLYFLEKVGKRFPLFGGVYILAARAKVIPLTPIKLKWKQQLSNMQIPPIIPGHIAR